MDRESRARLVERYRRGPDVLAAVVANLSDQQLDHRPRETEWTPREIVHHVADSELTSAIRLRRLIAEDAPVIDGYDENLFARRLHYGERPIAGSLAAVHAARNSSADLLDHLSEDEWLRAGTHSESGRYSVEDWLQIYADHAHNHAEQIKQALPGT